MPSTWDKLQEFLKGLTQKQTVPAGQAHGTSFIDDLFGTAATILNPFKTSPAGQKKIVDTKSQQAVEQTARAIAQQAQSGALGPDEALAALDDLQRGLVNMSQGGASIAGALIAQLKADIQNQRSGSLSQPYDKSQGLTGSVPLQQDKLTTLLRNRGLGSEQGSGIDDTPFGSVFKPRTSPFDMVGEGAQRIKDAYPEPPQYGAFRDKLKARKPLGGGY